MESVRRELKRGTIELVLLTMLDGEDRYGYDIVSTLERRGGDFFQIKEGTLYPVLYRLEDDGYIESYRDNPKRGVPRKYYKLTDKGRIRLGDLQKEWQAFRDIVDGFIAGREDNHEQA
ncbi:PadR family transcriptional regulator [bacterium]|nr:PadR family transcriptional regulator [bacterium]